MILLYILLSRLLGTILIEICCAFIVGVRKMKDYLNIILVNIVTNPVLVIMVFTVRSKFGILPSYGLLLMLELLAFLIEGKIYSKYLEYKKINHYKLSFILNITSFIIGLLANYM